MEQELKQKQIEEIDIILRSHLHSQIAYKMDISKFGGFEGYSPVFSSDMAKSIYNAGYRKITEGAVVILDEGMEDFAEMFVKSPQMQETMNGLIKAWKKETADKLLDEIDYESNGQTKSITDLLRKKYGV